MPSTNRRNTAETQRESSYVPLGDEFTMMSLRTMYHNKIRAICEFYLGTHLELPSGLKHLKPTPPDKYDGEDDVDDFIDWVIQVCRHFLLSGLSGKRYDSLRKLSTAAFFGKRPRKWYDNKVAKIGLANVKILYCDGLICLFDRYVRAVSSDKAYARYVAITYNTEDGVQGLFDELLEAAEKLITVMSAF
jgi:hypothetical protein